MLEVVLNSPGSWMTSKGGHVVDRSPLCLVESIAEPHHWMGSAYAVKVPTTWEPQLEKGDGEAEEIRWWNTAELRCAISTNHEQFMILHLPALLALLDRLG